MASRVLSHAYLDVLHGSLFVIESELEVAWFQRREPCVIPRYDQHAQRHAQRLLVKITTATLQIFLLVVRQGKCCEIFKHFSQSQLKLTEADSS